VSPERFGCPPLEKSEKDVIENGNPFGHAYRPPTPDEAAKQVSTGGSAHLAPSQGSFPPGVFYRASSRLSDDDMLCECL
jgi:hypothetical protein